MPQAAPEAPAKVSRRRQRTPAPQHTPNAASKGNGKEPQAPAEGTKADQCLALAARPEGATAAQFNDLTGWAGAPWRWLFSNKNNTGWCDKAGLRFTVDKVGKTAVYRVAA